MNASTELRNSVRRLLAVGIISREEAREIFPELEDDA